MTIAAEVSRMIADHELHRMGLRSSDVGMSRDTLAASYAPIAERIVAHVRGPLPSTTLQAIGYAKTRLQARLRSIGDIYGRNAEVILAEELGELARRAQASKPDAEPMLKTLAMATRKQTPPDPEHSVLADFQREAGA